MTCYSWEDLLKPIALIGAFFVGGVMRQLIISSYIVQLGSSHRRGWRGFNQTIFVIWWWSLSSVLEILLEARLFGESRASLCYGLCRERGTLGSLRTLGRRQRWCGMRFISLFLFGLIVQTFLNPILWVQFSLIGCQFAHLRVGSTGYGFIMCISLLSFCIALLV